jgi:HSP20 family molecular chaperone IbpA
MQQRANRKKLDKKVRPRERGNRESLDRIDANAEAHYPILFDFAESDDELILRCELPGVSDEKHRICVEPRRVKICALQAAKQLEGEKGIAQKCRSTRCLQVLNLPMEVDPSVTKATLDCDMLELRMPRAVEAPASVALPKAS